ncbi:MAG TPA: site-2 protease family protein [Conexibacter sp.]|jgi:Zn-dependent protease|nr:site-2 protease family protein [Conexibacter sp.]
MEQRADWLPPITPTPPPAAPEDVGLPPVKPRSRLGRIFGPLAVLGAGLAKLKGVLLLLPKLKLLTTSGSMLVSVAAYSLIWGWKFAAGFVLLLLVHEMGHVIQLRREGIEASAPMFIPFLGAVVAAKSLGDDAAAEARVGLAGPVLGSLGAALLVPVWLSTGNDFWQALAFTGFFLNLFNLLPVVPLDGGRAMAAMAPWMWFVGLAAMAALAIVFPNPIILVILVFAALSTWHRWKALRAGGEASAAYYRVTRTQRALVALVYIGLIAALVVGMDATHLTRTLSSV